MESVWIHSENHKHDGHVARIKNLLLAAERGELVLLFEGNEFVDPSRGVSDITVYSHGLNVSTRAGFVNGLEQITGTARFHWAGVLRYATGCGFKESARLYEAGQCGIRIVRQLCILLAKMSREIASCDRLLKDLESALGADLLEFASTLSDSFGSVEVDGSSSCKLADDLAVQRGKWPGKTTAFSDVIWACCLLAPHVPGLEGDMLPDLEAIVGVDRAGRRPTSCERELLQEAVDSVIIYEREGTFAKSINEMRAFRMQRGDGAHLPIHIVVGASHAYGVISDDYVHRLGLELGEFITQQKRVTQMAVKDPSKKRLWELVNCRSFSNDPFCE
jgi:hypothetical protein